jgi:hypothetical protein
MLSREPENSISSCQCRASTTNLALKSYTNRLMKISILFV